MKEKEKEREREIGRLGLPFYQEGYERDRARQSFESDLKRRERENANYYYVG